jgi:hypothetical protein
VARPQEQRIYALFKSTMPELAGALDDLSDESPDVIATCVGGRRIGIELTGYFHGTARKGAVSQVQREEFERRVVKEAQRIFESNSGPPLHVGVIWFGHVVTDPPEQLAQALADLVAAHVPTVPPTTTYVSLRIENYDLPEWLAQWVHVVTVLRTARNTAHYWSVPQSGYIDASANGIRERILDKEHKLSSYRQSDENWLLIHSGDHTMAASMTLHPLAAEEVYTTVFDRIYVLDFSGHVHQLRTC